MNKTPFYSPGYTLEQPPFTLDGSFSWLLDQPDVRSYSDEFIQKNLKNVEQLFTELTQHGINIPLAFKLFLETPALWQKIRTPNGSFVDIYPHLIPSPEGEDYLVRFISDSQYCHFLYLYVQVNSSYHAIIWAQDGFDEESIHHLDDENYGYNLAKIYWESDDFESYMYDYVKKSEEWFYENRELLALAESLHNCNESDHDHN